MNFSGMKRLALTGLVFWAGLTLGPKAWPGPDGDALAADLQALRDAGVATDESGLLGLFRPQAGGEDQQRRVAALIRQLGDVEFATRERASRELKALGRAARAGLEEAARHEDAEVASRAKLCLEALDGGGHAELLARAARVLSARKAARAVEAFLAFLPDAVGHGVEEDVIGALAALGTAGGEAHPALVRALADVLPLRRAAAGAALAGAGLPECRVAVRRLTEDADVAVRLRVALALACAGDREAVPVLIDALPQLDRDQAWQVEDILYRLGGGQGPALQPGGPAGQKFRDECRAWWRENGAKADLALLAGGPRRKAVVSARAARSWANNGPARAFDGDRRTVWNAGNPPPAGGVGQWVEADLGASRQLGRVALVAAQSPGGPTAHEVWVSDRPIGDDRGDARLVHTFKGPTQDGDVLRLDFPKGSSGRYVQVRTTASPSWVAWAEIELGIR